MPSPYGCDIGLHRNYLASSVGRISENCLMFICTEHVACGAIIPTCWRSSRAGCGTAQTGANLSGSLGRCPAQDGKFLGRDPETGRRSQNSRNGSAPMVIHRSRHTNLLGGGLAKIDLITALAHLLQTFLPRLDIGSF